MRSGIRYSDHGTGSRSNKSDVVTLYDGQRHELRLAAVLTPCGGHTLHPKMTLFKKSYDLWSFIVFVLDSALEFPSCAHQAELLTTEAHAGARDS